MKAAEKLAFDTLNTVWAKNGQVSIPVDPVSIAHKLNVTVFTAHLDNCDGLIVETSAHEPRIYLNRNLSGTKRRFTSPIELGAYLNYRGRGVSEYGHVTGRDATQDDELNLYTQTFAQELLMPGFVVRKWWGQGRSVSWMAHRFSVSRDVMTIRLDSLGLLEP